MASVHGKPIGMLHLLLEGEERKKTPQTKNLRGRGWGRVRLLQSLAPFCTMWMCELSPKALRLQLTALGRRLRVGAAWTWLQRTWKPNLLAT
jgi:hypothetical protein